MNNISLQGGSIILTIDMCMWFLEILERISQSIYGESTSETLFLPEINYRGYHKNSLKHYTSLYKALSKEGNPYLKTTNDILSALGMHLQVTQDQDREAG